MAAWPRADATVAGALSVHSLRVGVNLVLVPFVFAVMQFDALETSSLSPQRIVICPAHCLIPLHRHASVPCIQPPKHGIGSGERLG
jgi:hypothetical protein